MAKKKPKPRKTVPAKTNEKKVPGKAKAVKMAGKLATKSTLDELLKIMPPPAKPVFANGAWHAVEAKIGTALPEDYKNFMAVYGTGAIDNFIWVLSPFSENKNLNLIEKGQVLLAALNELRHETIPYPLHPNPNGLLPWGITDNGDVIYWQCKRAPSDWVIVVNESRGPRWQEFALLTTDFLKGVVAKEIAVDVFPEDFPSDSVQFEPL